VSTLLRQHAAPASFNHSRFEQRRDSRYKCPRLARVFPIDTPKSLARLSIVRDISANGIGLILTISMSPGTLINVEMCGRVMLNRVAQVVHSTRTEDGWIVACKLDNPLSDQEVQGFRS
jgi:hypothetical protein